MAGRDAKARLGFESAEGIPSGTMVSVPFSTESLDMTYDYVRSANIDPSGNRSEGEILKATGSGNIAAEINTEDYLIARYHMHEGVDVTSPEAGVHVHTLSDEATPHTFYTDSLNLGVSRAEEENPTEYNILGAKASQMTLTVAANQRVTMQHDLLFLRDRYSDNPTDIAVNAAWTGKMFTRGHRAAGDENGDYYKFKVVDPGAIGVATVVWGKGAGAYGATEYLTGTVMNVMNADDTLAGSRKVPYQILIIPGGVLTADDEFRINPLTGDVEPEFSERPKLTGAAAEVEFTMGTTFTRIIEQFTLSQFVPREAKFSVGSIYAQKIGLPDDAQRYWTFGFNSRYVDTKLKQALLQSRPITVHAKMYGGYIGETTREDFGEFTLPAMKFTAAGATVANTGDLPENPELESTGANPCTEVWQNTIASVEPD